MADEPMADERLAEIRARAEASWQMLEKSDTISVEVALTRDSLALLAEVDRLRAREAATREVIQLLSACEAVQHPTFTLGGVDGVLLFHPTRNVLWMRAQARKLVGDDLQARS